MNARLRRMTTSGMLVLAALSFGCGADSQRSVLDDVLPGVLGQVPQPAAESTAFATTHAASVVAGKPGDADTANMTADALVAILRGGALQAASPTGGAITDSSMSSMQFAALPTSTSGTPPVSSDAQLPQVAVRSLRRLLVLALGPTFSFDGDTLRVTASDGTSLTLTGVSPLPAGEVPAGAGAPQGFTMSEDVHVTGSVNLDGMKTVDLHIRGLTGTMVFRDDHVYPDLEIGANGISLSGTAADFGATIAITGAKGHFTSAAEINQLLAGKELAVQITGARGGGYVTSGSARLTVTNLQLPTTGSRPAGRVYGSGDISFDRRLEFAQEGRVAHAGFEIASDRALVFDETGDLPRSGRIVASIHYATGNATDTLVITFTNGEASFEGQLTNASGNPETVSTQGDATTATGSVVFVDGRTSDHKIEVRRRTGGRRNIVFTVAIRNAQGVQLLNLIGAIRSDKGVAGTWARSSFAGSVAGTNPSTGVRPALPATAVPQVAEVGFERAGAFRVNAGGTLELVSEGGEVLARGAMPADWNKGL